MSNILLSPKEQLYLEFLEDLNKPSFIGEQAGLTTRLHDGQIEILKHLYNPNSKVNSLFIQCGRKFGKTVLVEYALWRNAGTVPFSVNYYVAPENEHGRKLVWDAQRLQRFLGSHSHKYLTKINEKEMKITLWNGSFIQVIGSENWQVANGLTPDFVVYDEFKIFHPKWHTEMNPNRLAKGAPLLIIGTPPKPGDKNEEEYFSISSEFKNNKNSLWFQRSSYDNPVIPPERIDDEIAKLRARGEEEVVQREYFARIVPGGKSAIFPMLSKENHQRPHKELLGEISKDISKLEWYCITDPGTTTCFAALIGCLNPYTKKLYILDEVYEKDQLETSVRKIYPRLDLMMNNYYPGSDIDKDWFKVSDEAAAWFINEVMDHYGTYFSPTRKFLSDKEEGLSLIKDQLLFDLIVISDKCENLWWEMEKYAKDDKGKIPKKNDHLIDSLRYLNHAANYNMVEVLERKKQDSDELRIKKETPYDYLDSLNHENDWTSSIMKFDWED